MFKNLLNKAKEKIIQTDVTALTDIANQARDKVQTKMKEHNIDEVVNKVKKEGSIISKAVSVAASELYKENEETLEKPVSIVTDAWGKVSKHSEEIKWAGGVVIGVAAPMTTLLASTAYFLLSEDDEDTKKSTNKNKEKPPMIVKNSFVEVVVDFKNKTMEGVVLKGSFADCSFDEVGYENLMNLSNILQKSIDQDIKGLSLSDEQEEMKETIKLITRWLNLKNK